VRKREIFGWAMFDFANSSFTTVVVTVVYADYFTSRIVPPGPAYSYWSLAIIAGTLLTLFLSPLAGSIADYAGSKKRYLVLTAVICSLGTAMLWFVRPGNVAFGVAIVAVGHTAFLLGEAFCGSFLPDIARRDNMARISGFGWGLGYFGGLASLLLVQAIVTADPEARPGAFDAQNRLAMVATGAFFLLSAVPTFLLLRDRSRPVPGFEGASPIRLFRAGLSEFRATFRLVRRYRILFRFLVAFTVYMAGLYAIISFVGIYAGQELRMTYGERAILFVVAQVSAAAGALLFGLLESRAGPKATVLLTLAWWVLGVGVIYFVNDLASGIGISPKTLFILVALVTGSAMGATQSSSRAVVGLLTPRSRSSQMFGFWGAFARVAALLAMTYGFLADAIGSLRHAMLLVLAFFVVGALLLAATPLGRGIEEAAREDPEDGSRELAAP